MRFPASPRGTLAAAISWASGHFGCRYQLGQPLDDGALAHARFADEDGVVLLSPAQYLGDALDLVLAAHDGVQLAFFGRQRQVGAEVVDDGCVASALFLLACRVGRAAFAVGSAAGKAVLLLVLVGHAEGRAYVGLEVEGRGHFLVCDFVFVQDGAPAVAAVVQHGQEQMFAVGRGASGQPRFEQAKAQYACAFLVHFGVRFAFGELFFMGDFLLRAAAQHVGREAKAVQGRCGLSLAFMQDAQQQMGRTHRPAVQTEGFVAAVA